MAKIPKWRREFNKRMAAQLREFAKAKDKNLTQFTYTNGSVKMVQKKFFRSAWGRRTRDWRKERNHPAYEAQWTPNGGSQ